MSTYKIHRKADGSIGGYGPNNDQYEPNLAAGDTLEYSDVQPEMPSEKIKAEIAALEEQQTRRRLREAALTEEGMAWLQNLEYQISAKRAELAGLS